MTSVPGIEPQTSRSQVQHITTKPRTLLQQRIEHSSFCCSETLEPSLQDDTTLSYKIDIIVVIECPS